MCTGEQHRMVLEVLSHAWQITADLDTERTQVLRGSNSGSHQQRRRLDAAAAQDHLPPAEFALCPRDRSSHAYGMFTVEQNFRNDRLCDDRQILSAACRGIQIANGGG